MEQGEFEARIHAAQDDAAELKRIADELTGHAEAWSGRLRMTAIALRLKARPAASARTDLVAATYEHPPWLARYDLPLPDGRPLYRYRLPGTQFERLQADLGRVAAAMRFQARPSEAALLVLWAAEWFRRSYAGGMQRWEDVGRPIGLQCKQGRWRKLADTGLRQWRIKELRINGTHHRLAAIARQGGFPVAALEGSGWAAQYLERLVGLLLAETDPVLETADIHAAGLAGTIPETWRNDEMRIVSAELALEVVRLRRVAEAAGVVSGELVSAWLDRHREGWREELPLVVDGTAGVALVDGLLRAAPLRGGSGAIRANRSLRLIGDRREERVRLSLNGAIEIPSNRSGLVDLSAQWSRLRLYPAGGLAQRLSGELAVAEPDEGDRWSARGSVARTDLAFPYDTQIEAELRGEGQRVCGPFIIPGGERVGDGLRVFVSDAEASEAVGELTLAGTGSGGYRAEPVYADLPAGWTIAAQDEAAECNPRHETSDGRSVWEVRGTALAISERGDKYLVRTGQKGDRRDTLALIGETPRGCECADKGALLLSGFPRLELCGATRPRAPEAREAWWRPKNESRWRPYAGTAALGLVEFGWLDADTRHIRDRRDAAILPVDFAIERCVTGSWLTLTISGWPGTVEIAGERSGNDGCSWRFPLAGSNASNCQVQLRQPDAATLSLVVPLPHHAWIAHWIDGPVPCDGALSLSTIQQFVARTDGRCELMADLIDRDGRLVNQGQMNWWVDGELALSTIRDDVAALLRPLGELDAKVKLNFNDSHENFWYISEFDNQLRYEGRGLTSSRAVIGEDIRVIGRALAEPIRENDFGSYGLGGSANHRPIKLPTLTGDWLIYLREQGRVLTRPFFLRGRELVVPPPSRLARAMAHQDGTLRAEALATLCDDIVTDPGATASRPLLRSVIDLALSLEGLPPATFDILALVAARSALGPLLLFNAAATEVESLLALSEGLPFAWTTIAKRHWEAAAHIQFEQVLDTLPGAVATAAEAIGARRRAIAELDPALSPLLDCSAPAISLHEAMQSFLNRSDDRITDTMPSPFRPALDAVLPAWPVNERFHRALDAPVAAARAAQEQAVLNRGQIYCVKEVARRHPRYFREAFAAALKGA